MTEEAKTTAANETSKDSLDVNLASQINARLGGWVSAMHLHFLFASGDKVTAEMQVGPDNRRGQTRGDIHDK